MWSHQSDDTKSGHSKVINDILNATDDDDDDDVDDYDDDAANLVMRLLPLFFQYKLGFASSF